MSIVRIIKRWLATHLFTDYITDITIELLVTHLFLSPTPYTVPNSMLQGLQRFFQLILKYDWNSTPLILDLNNTLKPEQIELITTNFQRKRSKASGSAMYIVTEMDMEAELAPITSETLTRLQLYCGSSQTYLTTQLSTMTTDTRVWKTLFKTPLTTYDLLIHVNTSVLPLMYLAQSVINPLTGSTKVTKKTYKPSLDSVAHTNELAFTSSIHAPLVEFNVMQHYLSTLRYHFGSFAQFYYDGYGGSIIAVQFSTSAFETRPFKVATVASTEPVVDGEVKGVRVSKEQVVEEMKILGTGVVERIVVQHRE